MVQQAPLSFCVGLHHTRAEGGGVPGGCFSRVTLSVKAGEGQLTVRPVRRIALSRTVTSWPMRCARRRREVGRIADPYRLAPSSKAAVLAARRPTRPDP